MGGEKRCVFMPFEPVPQQAEAEATEAVDARDKFSAARLAQMSSAGRTRQS
jgi:hypothetical protein